MQEINLLTYKDVIEIHSKLSLDAEKSEDPISPPGIKNRYLLESAISRQESGFNGKYKYKDPLSNAASLCYGICCNHPFHNGNKRTALVSMMCHLDKNNYTFNDRTNQDDLYSFMMDVASHKLAFKKIPAKNHKQHDKSDLEVEAMSLWIRKRTRKIEKSERNITYVELEKILRDHDIFFENHKDNYVDLYKITKKRKLFWGETVLKTKLANIPYWPNRTVGKNLIKSIRSQAGLTFKDGIDSTIFYGIEKTPDDFIQKYKKVLSKLAKT